MALVKRIDFGKALGIKDGTIRSKISRKQLCCNKKGLIDTENPKNYAYLLEINGGNQDVFVPYDLNSKSNIQRKVITQTISSEKNQNTKKTKVEKHTQSIDSIDENEKIENLNTSNNSKKNKEENSQSETETPEERKIRREEERARKELLDYDLRLKKANAISKEREAELKTMEIEKRMGNTIPLDKAESLMAINFKAIFKSFHSNLKNIASTTVHRLGGTNEDLHEVMTELEQILDHVVEKSKEKAAHDIELLVQEYSEKRSRGERK